MFESRGGVPRGVRASPLRHAFLESEGHRAGIKMMIHVDIREEIAAADVEAVIPTKVNRRMPADAFKRAAHVLH